MACEASHLQGHPDFVLALASLLARGVPLGCDATAAVSAVFRVASQPAIDDLESAGGVVVVDESATECCAALARDGDYLSLADAVDSY